MRKEITVEIKPQYGKWVYYPVCEDAKAFARIAGTSTLTESTIAAIRQLGYKIKAHGSMMELVNSMISK